MSLTALAIKALKPKPSLYRVADSGGLCLEVAPSGGKLWRYHYRFNSKAQMVSLGRYPEISLEQARKKRDEIRSTLESGKHPTREKKAQKLRRAVAGENTFERIARAWLALKSKKLNEKYAKQTLARMEQHVFPLIGALPIPLFGQDGLSYLLFTHKASIPAGSAVSWGMVRRIWLKADFEAGTCRLGYFF